MKKGENGDDVEQVDERGWEGRGIRESVVKGRDGKMM